MDVFKDRKISECTKVRVYFNLHTKRWSIKAMEGEHKGKVVAHADRVYLQGCKFIVSKAGRERVIKEQKKNVHAYVEGNIILKMSSEDCAAWYSPYNGEWKQAYYNPYKTETFVDGSKVLNSIYRQVEMTAEREVYYRY